MPPDVFALMLMAVMLATALPAWAWWAAADDAGPDALPDLRLQAAIAANVHRVQTFPFLSPQLKELT